MSGILFLPQGFQVSPGLRNILEERRQGFATIARAGGTVLQAALKNAETNTALCAMAERPSPCHAAITQDFFCGDRGDVLFHPPFLGYLFQGSLVVGLGGRRVLTFGTIEPAGSTKDHHGVTSW
jgi:hypothetical protein